MFHAVAAVAGFQLQSLATSHGSKLCRLVWVLSKRQDVVGTFSLDIFGECLMAFQQFEGPKA